MAKNALDFHTWRRSEASVSVKLCQQGYDAYDRGEMAEAFALFQRSARAGYSEAQYMLGYCYQAGHGVESCAAEAEKWYDHARSKGFPVDFYLGLFEKME